MAPPKQSDAAPSTPPVPEEFQSQKDFSPLQKGGYEDIPPVSGSKTGRSDFPSTTEMAVAAGVAVVDGYFNGYPAAVERMLTGLELINQDEKLAGHDSGMMTGAGGKTGDRVNLNKLPGATDTVNGALIKDTTGITDTVHRIADAIKSMDSKKIAAEIRGWNDPIKSDVKDGPKIVSEITNNLDRYRPEVAKRAKFNDAMAALAEDFPDSFQASQELMQAAFKMAQTGKFDRDDLARMTQAAAKEFGEDRSGDAAKRFSELNEQLEADYGISIKVGSEGLEITNVAEGKHASSVTVDKNGSMTGKIDTGRGDDAPSVPAEVALKDIVETRRAHAFDMGRKEAPKPMIIEGVGPKIDPTKPFEPGGKEMPKPRPLPQKRYQFGNGHPLNLEAL